MVNNWISISDLLENWGEKGGGGLQRQLSDTLVFYLRTTRKMYSDFIRVVQVNQSPIT